MRRVTLIDAMADPNLFAPWFRDPASWSAWRAFLSALFALPMPDEQLAIYNRCTGRAEPPTAPAAEGWLVCGRRAGKSFILALIAVFLATFYDYRRYLAPGERGTVIVIATNTRQARVIFRYVRALLTGVPMLKRMIERETADTFDLTDGVTIEVGTTSFKTVRGYTIVAALCDELAFWPTDDSAEPDYEVLNALRPGMVTIPNAMLLCASSPYARRGALWDAHRRHFGKDDDPILVWHADTRTMNPTVPQRVIDEATERDPAWAAAEYGAQFRSDVESFVSREAVEACVVARRARAPAVVRAQIPRLCRSERRQRRQHARSRSRTGEGRRHDCDDAVRERRPPFSPEDVVAEFAALLKSYRIAASPVTGTPASGRASSSASTASPTSSPTRPKSELFRDLLPRSTHGRIVLPRHDRLLEPASRSRAHRLSRRPRHDRSSAERARRHRQRGGGHGGGRPHRVQHELGRVGLRGKSKSIFRRD